MHTYVNFSNTNISQCIHIDVADTDVKEQSGLPNVKYL